MQIPKCKQHSPPKKCIDTFNGNNSYDLLIFIGTLYTRNIFVGRFGYENAANAFITREKHVRFIELMLPKLCSETLGNIYIILSVKAILQYLYSWYSMY